MTPYAAEPSLRRMKWKFLPFRHSPPGSRFHTRIKPVWLSPLGQPISCAFSLPVTLRGICNEYVAYLINLVHSFPYGLTHNAYLLVRLMRGHQDAFIPIRFTWLNNGQHFHLRNGARHPNDMPDLQVESDFPFSIESLYPLCYYD